MVLGGIAAHKQVNLFQPERELENGTSFIHRTLINKMIHLIVGNTGARKTTHAKYLKTKNKGIVFSIDTWNKALFLPDKKEINGLPGF